MNDPVTAPKFSAAYLRWVIFLLFMVYVINYADRMVIGVVGESIKRDLRLSDMQLGLLGGLAFIVLYVVVSFPVGRLAERYSRKTIMWIVICVWSAATTLCGTAGSFWHLLMYRAAVGMGEGGFTPPLASIISDYFPPNRRATAFSLVILGLPIGGIVGAVLAGWITQHYGWRAVFFVVGPPGLILALIVARTLREPPRGYSEPERNVAKDIPSIRSLFKKLAQKPTFWHLCVGVGLINVTSYGLALFLFPHLVRNFGLQAGTAGLIVALVNSTMMAIGTGTAGLIVDRLGRSNIRWYAWAPCAGVLVAAPLYAAALLQHSLPLMIAFMLIPAALISAFSPSVQATTQGLVEPRMRGTTAAICGAIASAIGLGFGTVTTGLASDLFASSAFARSSPGADFHLLCEQREATGALAQACATAYGAGVRHALLASSVFLVWGAVHFFLASRRIAGDVEANYGAPPAPAAGANS